jgi:uncharacterized protein (DUF849 family)
MVWIAVAGGATFWVRPWPGQSGVFGSAHVVGLSDSLWIGKGRLAESNAQQVQKIRSIVEDMGKEIATPAGARAMLRLRGTERTGGTAA